MDIVGNAILDQALLTLCTNYLNHVRWYSDKMPPDKTHMGCYTTKRICYSKTT